jgi:hypothetical protein
MGQDPNMDWMNLKIRRVYFQTYKKTKNHDKAVAAMLDYVANNEKKKAINKYVVNPPRLAEDKRKPVAQH